MTPDVWVLLLPALIPIVVLSLGPLIYGVYLGFTDARAGLYVPTDFIGLANFKELVHDDLFWSSFKIGLVWAVSVTVLQFVLSLGLALLLNVEGLRFRGLARVLALVPWAMPPVVIGIMWRLVYHPDAGILNQTLQSVGVLHHNVDWLSGFAIALPAVIVVGVWTGMPQTTVTLLAALQGVPGELGEAAALDGAGAWARFRVVSWPAIKPVVVSITTLNFIWNFNEFGLVYVLTAGGPGGKTQLPMLFAYMEAFRYGHFGYAAALGDVMVVVIAVLLVVYMRAQSRGERS
ncbi:carbohydrate ABC transporter permease [Streptantibioticus silvisoli]|jgi:multiple sugar transport system permease protein|uniref:Sugar ABC transporter permease n=1 Tax=Streptantibioticus silvisoli TaxID=2705255 RepID=A0ABT6VUH4_9ACTN|nr:sugar ABC transporter permease [Streptantibioticus silvisoli]MDI5961714.1 sugar ABC transporter permease [Streptantibioticus silvisoli]